MERFINGYFYNPSRGNLMLNLVMEEMINWMKEKPEAFYDIVIGCDSSSGEEPNFPVAIVILRKGEGGRFFLKKIAYQDRKFYNWKTRILEEVLISCELALYLRENFTREIELIEQKFNYQLLYIHADVGENGKTRDMIKEVVGLIKGNGFEPKIKPESFAASVIADRYT